MISAIPSSSVTGLFLELLDIPGSQFFSKCDLRVLSIKRICTETKKSLHRSQRRGPSSADDRSRFAGLGRLGWVLAAARMKGLACLALPD